MNELKQNNGLAKSRFYCRKIHLVLYQLKFLVVSVFSKDVPDIR